MNRENYNMQRTTQYSILGRYDIIAPTSSEVKEVAKKLARRRAPGPDVKPTELTKEMNGLNSRK